MGGFHWRPHRQRQDFLLPRYRRTAAADSDGAAGEHSQPAFRPRRSRILTAYRTRQSPLLQSASSIFTTLRIPAQPTPSIRRQLRWRRHAGRGRTMREQIPIQHQQPDDRMADDGPGRPEHRQPRPLVRSLPHRSRTCRPPSPIPLTSPSTPRVSSRNTKDNFRRLIRSGETA